MVTEHKNRGSMARGFRMGKLGLSLTGSYLGYQLQSLFLNPEGKAKRKKNFHESASRQIREELQSLKGAVMKVGQALSMQTHALPAEVTQELANLQMKAPPMHPSLARAQFKASYGQYPEKVFREFAPEPLAAASLGQVHRAVTHEGQIVAVKIQYPAIRTAIESDFKLLRSAAWAGKLTKHIPDAALVEIESGILKETDYVNEAANLDFFHDGLQSLSYVRVPQPLRKYSTDRILTMSFLDGIALDELLASKPSAAIRSLIGHRLFELFLFQSRRVHALHADPHLGNYLFGTDGTIGLVDFGVVTRFSPDFIELIGCFTDQVWNHGPEKLARMTQLACGTSAGAGSHRAKESIKQAIVFYQMVLPGGVVDFGQTRLIDTLTELWKEFLRNKLINPELIFASRAELGLYNLLHRLDVKINTADVMAKVLKMKEPSLAG